MSRRRAEEILAKMAHNPDGDYTQKDYEKLYLGFGFTKRNGTNHVLYSYAKYQLRATVARHNLHDRYAEDAVKNIGKLKEFLSQETSLLPGEDSNVTESQQAKQNLNKNNRNQRKKHK